MNDRTAAANVTPVRQRTQFTCMATSMMMALKANGVPDVDEDTVNRVMGAAPMRGASWEQALACAQYFGMRATLVVPATVRQLKEWTDRGVPVMIAWNPEGRDWSHASLVFDVDADLNVYVADPNIPDPDETVRVVSKADFYKKWFEKWPDYLVRRPAMAIEREVTPDGRQVVAGAKKAEAYDCVQDYRSGGLTWEEYQECLKQFENEGRSRPAPRNYAAEAQWFLNWAEIARLMGRESDARFISSVAQYVLRRGMPSPEQGRVLDRIRQRYTRELADPARTLRELRQPKPAPAAQFDPVAVDALQSLVQRTGNGFLRGMLALIRDGKPLSEDQMKAIRAQFHRMGLHDKADLFRPKTASGEFTVAPALATYDETTFLDERDLERPREAKAPVPVQMKKRDDNVVHVDAPKPRSDAARALAERGGRGQGTHHNRERDVDEGRSRKPKYPRDWSREAEMARMSGYEGNPGGKDIYPVKVDHGYDEPLSGGWDIMKRLQDRLVTEQGRPEWVREPNPRLAAYSPEDADQYAEVVALFDREMVRLGRKDSWWLPAHNLVVNIPFLGHGFSKPLLWMNFWAFTILPMFANRRAYMPADPEHGTPAGIVLHPNWTSIVKPDELLATLENAQKVLAAARQRPMVGETVEREMAWIEREFHIDIPSAIKAKWAQEAPRVAARRWSVDRVRLKDTFVPLDGRKPVQMGSFGFVPEIRAATQRVAQRWMMAREEGSR